MKETRSSKSVPESNTRYDVDIVGLPTPTLMANRTPPPGSHFTGKERNKNVSAAPDEEGGSRWNGVVDKAGGALASS